MDGGPLDETKSSVYASPTQAAFAFWMALTLQ
jgi:hypothetical protein